jgi:hypothetical protein
MPQPFEPSDRKTKPFTKFVECNESFHALASLVGLVSLDPPYAYFDNDGL